MLDLGGENLAGRELLVEKDVHLRFAEAHLDRPFYGWVDVAAVPIPVTVCDFKSGHTFVPADAVQLGLYLLGLVLDLTDGRLEGDGHVGTTVIMQPRAEGAPVRTHDWTWQDLRDLRDRVINLLHRIKRKDFTFKSGEHCRWCPALAVCPHLAAVARDAALAKVVPTPELIATGEVTAAKLDEWLVNADVLESLIKQLNAVAQDYLIHGGKLRTRKLVKKRTNRR